MDLATSIITNTITVGKLLNPEVATMWRLGMLDIPSTSCNTIGKVLFPEVARLGMLAVTNAKLYCSFRGPNSVTVFQTCPMLHQRLIFQIVPKHGFGHKHNYKHYHCWKITQSRGSYNVEVGNT